MKATRRARQYLRELTAMRGELKIALDQLIDSFQVRDGKCNLVWHVYNDKVGKGQEIDWHERVSMAAMDYTTIVLKGLMMRGAIEGERARRWCEKLSQK